MVDVNLFPFQVKIMKSQKPLIVAICGRSSGKSHAAAWWAFKKSNECDGMGLITAPIYQQAEMPIKYLMGICDMINIPYVFNKAPKFAHSSLPSHTNIFSMLIGGKLKQIKMASSDIEDNLRSGSYSWALLDEGCYISEQAWNILAPTLRGQGNDFNYQVLITSSPAGKNWVYSMFLENKSENIDTIRAPSWENIYQVNEEKLALWKETMSKRMYQQEVEALILDSNLNSIFYAYTKDAVQPQKADGMKYIVSLDQNTCPGAGVIMQKRDKVFHVLDEIHIDDGATYESYIKEITKKVPAKATIDLCGDSSGNARNVAALQTFYSSVISGLKAAGYAVYDKTNRSNPSVYESREEINRLFERKLLWIDPCCKHLIRDCEMATWKEKGIFETDKATYDPHTAESLVYGVWAWRAAGIVATNNFFK
jgi:hypothetical protein